MSYVIVTARSLIWMVLSLTATLLMLLAIVSPNWLSAHPHNVTVSNETVKYTPSVGLTSKCSHPIRNQLPLCTVIGVKGFSTDSSIFPTVWKAATVFLALGLTVMASTVFSAILSCCFQSCFKKSIFTISGATQTIAGMFFILGVMLHPMAWGEPRVLKLCGRDAAAFNPNECTLGSGLWMAVTSTILTFFSACLSVSAEKSTSSDKVQDQISEGHTLICLA